MVQLLMNKLTVKQEKFCQEYVVDFNATQAAIRAGYKKNAAKQVGSENLSKLYLTDRIKELGKPMAKKLEVNREMVLEMILNMAKDGEQEGNRIKAMDMLGKVVGIYETDNMQQSNVQAIQVYLPQKEK